MRVRDYSRPTTLNPDRLFGQVAQKLAVAIITGAVKAGEVLPDEDDLRSDISVSRTAYREAVKVLTAKGLVEARPKSGTRAAPRESWNLLDPDVLAWHFEADPNEKFIRDLFELRRFAEPAAARLAAQRRTRPTSRGSRPPIAAWPRISPMTTSRSGPTSPFTRRSSRPPTMPR